MKDNLSKTQLDARCASRTATRQRGIGIGLALIAAILILPGLLAYIGAAHASGHPTEALLGIGFLGAVGFGPILKEAGEGGGGGGEVTDPLGKKIIEQIEGVRKLHEEITTKVAEIDGEGKKLSEEFAKAVKQYDGLGSDVVKVMKTMGDLEKKIANVRLYDSGADAMTRIRRDADLCHLADSIIRGMADRAKKNINVAANDDHRKTFKDYTDRQTKALTEGATPGSYTIDDRLHTEMYSLIAEYGVWPIFDVIPVGTMATKLITDDTDPTMGFVAENTAPGSEAAVTGSSASVSVKKAMAYMAVSSELMEDSEIDIVGYLLPKFANAAALRADHICLAADGTDDATDGTYTGLFSGGTTSSLAATENTIEEADYADFLNVLLAPAASVLSRPTTRWFAHPQMIVRILSILDGNNRPIFLPALDAPAPGALGSILGYPVTLAHAAPNTNTAELPVLAFGDAKGQALLMRRQLTFGASEHFQFDKDNTVFRATTRFASKTRKATAFGVMVTGTAS